eukprot:CAMPEP_0195520932 /NCGR_PEP_ID=MMETSP0794_2-20130614/17627_1 /TAXON_ID=515487 /ORGANISM="Stephanopyxis turris, Strain CCMP 815" /LENGTH=539 /DNA_ID=CAMNT_0040650377 /DNA_START=216 /DNA_END=1835 /DNA_ORIENTATION=+
MLHEEVQKIFERDCTHQRPLIFLHPEEDRDYRDEELEALNYRDFETRLFIGAIAIHGRSVWVRTHFTDNAKYTTHLNFVRDYFKAAFATKNYTAANAALADLLTSCFQMDRSEYYTFVCMIASGLSRNGKNTSFQIHDELVSDRSQLTRARLHLCLLMDVIFNKMSVKKFLIDDNGSNIYRLVHCMTKGNKNKNPIIIALFCFALQFCLVFYVVAEISTKRNQYDVKFLPLAVIGTAYSAMIAYPNMVEVGKVYRFYGKIGWLQMTDFIVNQILTVILLLSGFILILSMDSYIEAVLNASALLFIGEIDDQLPSLLGYDKESIVKDYLMTESNRQFVRLLSLSDECSKRLHRNISVGIPFCDFFLTNLPELGSRPGVGRLFQPYEVISAEHSGEGHRILPSNQITEDCLISVVEWKYTTLFPSTTQPRIGYLKLTKLNGEKVEITRKGANDDYVRVSNKLHEVKGTFIITTFQMSNDILRLRLCGSVDVDNFLQAFEYYSLWDISDDVSVFLKNHSSPVCKHQFEYSLSDISDVSKKQL